MQSFGFNPSFVFHRHCSSSSSVRDATFLMPQPTSASHTTRFLPFANEREVEDPIDEGEPFPVTMALPSSSSQTHRLPVYGWPSRSQPRDDPSLPTTSNEPLEYRTINNAPNDPMLQRDQSTAMIDAEMRPVPKKRRNNERRRYDILQNDPYVMSFTSTDVICSGCGGTIQLDKRGVARYYIHFWTKHKERCRGVKDGITAAKLHEFEALESY